MITIPAIYDKTININGLVVGARQAFGETK